MSEHNCPTINTSEDNQTLSCSEVVLQRSSTEEANSKAPRSSDEGDFVKKAPPVAPKPAWFRQSLKGLKKGNSDGIALAGQNATDHRSISDNEMGSKIICASARGSSIKQRINSFENLGTPQSPDKGNGKLSFQKEKSPIQKEPKSATVHQISSGNLGRQGSESTSFQCYLDLSILNSPCGSKEDHAVSKKTPSNQTALTESSLNLLPLQGIGPDPQVTKASSQRARSFPLTSAQSCEILKTSGEKYSKVYSFSNHFSSALMKSLHSLPQSPLNCGKNPGRTHDASTKTYPEESGTTGPLTNEMHYLDTGFSLK